MFEMHRDRGDVADSDLVFTAFVAASAWPWTRRCVAVGTVASAAASTHDHVATYWLPRLRPPKLDLLFVIDDTTAMASHQQPLAALPAQIEQMLDERVRHSRELSLSASSRPMPAVVERCVARPTSTARSSSTTTRSSGPHEQLSRLARERAVVAVAELRREHGEQSTARDDACSTRRKRCERRLSARRRVSRFHHDHRER